MSTAVGSNLISSYLIDCPPSRPTGNPAAFFCRQENISLLINLSTGIWVWTKAGKSISMSLVQSHLFLLKSFPSLWLPLFQPTSLASHLLPLLRLVTLMTFPHAPGGLAHEEAALWGPALGWFSTSTRCCPRISEFTSLSLGWIRHQWPCLFCSQAPSE